jgi:hypothetical protein
VLTCNLCNAVRIYGLGTSEFLELVICWLESSIDVFIQLKEYCFRHIRA